MKFFSFLFLFCLSAYSFAQSPKENLVNKLWTTVEGNTLFIEKDTLMFDNVKLSNYELTDSTLLLLLNNFYSNQTDTFINATYLQDRERLIINFKKVKLPEYANYSQHMAAKLSGKKAVYYSSSEKPRLSFKAIRSFQSRDSLSIDSVGNIFYTSFGKYVSVYFNNDSPPIYLRGVYKGKLDKKGMAELKKMLVSKSILQKYLGSSPLMYSGRYSYQPSYSIYWNDKQLNLKHSYLDKYLRQEIFSLNNRKRYHLKRYSSLTADTGEEFISYTPSPIMKQIGARELKTVSGSINLLDSIITKEKKVLIYKMVVDSMYHENETDYKKNDIVYFCSESRLHPNQNKKVGIVYTQHKASFADINNVWHGYSYLSVADTFPLDKVILFHFHREYYQPYYSGRGCPARRPIYALAVALRTVAWRFDPNLYYQREEPPPPKYFPTELDYKLVSKLKKIKGQPFINKIRK